MINLVRAKKIVKSYSKKGEIKTEVLKGVSIEIMSNESISIVGVSGVGKSTLLQIIGTLDNYDSGEVIYNFEDKEQELSKLSKKELNKIRNKYIGFIFQFHHLMPEFTALENVIMPALIAGESVNTAKEKAKQLFARAGIEGKENNRPSELSGGEQQRVAIARALINNPKLLIADEPTGNLDEANTYKFLDLLTELRKEHNISILTATHSKEVAEYADKYYRLESDGFADL